MKFLSSLLLLVLIVIAGCSGKTPPPNPAAAGAEAGSVQPAGSEQVAKQPPAPPPSRHAAMRDGIGGWLELASTCQNRWFRKVDPARLDKWELPVDVPAMEDDCDKLVFDYEALSKDYLLKGPELDSLFVRMAMVTDLYTHLALRCRKVGVKDRVPFKQMIAGLRDRLGAEVEAVVKEGTAVLALDDDTLVREVRDQAMMDRSLKALGRVTADMDEWIVKPRKEVGPVFKYSLKVSGRLAGGAAEALAQDASLPEKFRTAAAGLSKAWTVVSDFYAGDYLAEEEAKAEFLQKSVLKASVAYDKALGSFLKAGGRL